MDQILEVYKSKQYRTEKKFQGSLLRANFPLEDVPHFNIVTNRPKGPTPCRLCKNLARSWN